MQMIRKESLLCFQKLLKGRKRVFRMKNPIMTRGKPVQIQSVRNCTIGQEEVLCRQLPNRTTTEAFICAWGLSVIDPQVDHQPELTGFIVAFGIGSMIYSGLEFGQYFELERDTKCHNVLLALTPATRMAFIFIQMYFIFLNNEVSTPRPISRSSFIPVGCGGIDPLAQPRPLPLRFQPRVLILRPNRSI
jgi:hypothetical protein